MANKFWVGGGASTNWNAVSNTNWANSSGGPGNQTAPGSGDVAIFDSNSGTGNSVLNTAFTIQGLDCDGVVGTGTYGGTITHNTSTTLTINTASANSFRLTSGMTYTPASTSSLVTLTHTTGTANIKTYGKALAALTINGAGGTTQTLDDIKVNAIQNSALTVTSGIFDANNGAGGPYAITAYILNATSGSTRSLILGSTVTVGGNVTAGQNIFQIVGAGALTFTKNSANIVVLSPTSSLNGIWTMSVASQTFNNLTVNPSTFGSYLALVSTGTTTFANLSIGSGWTLNQSAGNTYVITNAFTWSGTQANPIMIANAPLATISCASGACTLNWGSLLGVTGSGGATFTATNTLNYGNVSGWSISQPADATVTPPAGLIAAEARGTVTTGGSTTSIPTSAFTFGGVAATGVVSNQFVGRVVIFDGATTTAGLRGAQSTISASSTSNTPTFTVATLPATPASGDLFSVI